MINFKSISKKIIVLFFVLIFSFFFINKKNYADTFYKNQINVLLKKDGSADIESIMDFHQTKGTEYYLPINNLSLSEIKNYRVSQIKDDVEIPYKESLNWDVKKTLQEKKNTYGIVRKSDGVELCFGVGDYSRKTFIIRYTVTNFIKNLKDSDMIFWKFINDNLSASPKKVKIIISKQDDEFTKVNSKIWAFGSKGIIEFKEGKIVFESTKELIKSNYVVILSKIDKGYFTGGEKINKDFSYYKEKAKASTYRKKRRSFDFRSFYLFLIPLLAFLKKFNLKGKFKGGYKKGDFKDQYYRDIPEKQWWKLSLILKSAKFDTTKSILRAYFLKWVQDGILIPIKDEKGIIFLKKEVMSLKINKKDGYKFEDKSEEKLFNMLEMAAKDDKILQENEFKKLLKDPINQKEFQNFICSLDTASLSYARENDLLEKNKKGEWTYNYNEKGKDFSEKLVKYYNYLKDFSLLSEREIQEIKVWKDLFIYATLFDITEVVEKQLKKLSPELIEQCDIDLDLDVLDIYMIYSFAFSDAFYESYSNSFFEEGGSVSYFGGSGSFGGGSGGGSR